MFFHRHDFDPEKWRLILEAKLVNEDGGLTGHKLAYSNTCKTCGDLVVRTFKIGNGG